MLKLISKKTFKVISELNYYENKSRIQKLISIDPNFKFYYIIDGDELEFTPDDIQHHDSKIISQILQNSNFSDNEEMKRAGLLKNYFDYSQRTYLSIYNGSNQRVEFINRIRSNKCSIKSIFVLDRYMGISSVEVLVKFLKSSELELISINFKLVCFPELKNAAESLIIKCSRSLKKLSYSSGLALSDNKVASKTYPELTSLDVVANVDK